MTTTVTPSTRNGVDTATLFATLDAVKAAPEAAAFQFRASNQWLTGTHSRSTIHGFAMLEASRGFQWDADPDQSFDWMTRFIDRGLPDTSTP